MTAVNALMNDAFDEHKSGVQLTEEQLRARRGRSIAIALALAAFVVVIFLVTIVRLGGPGVLSRPM